MIADDLTQKAARELRCRGNGGKLTWTQFSDKYGNPGHTPDAIRKRVERETSKRNKRNGSHVPSPVTIPPQRRKMEEVIAAAIADYMNDGGQDTEELEPVSPPRAASTDDTEEWEAWKKEHPEVTILFLGDTHIPDDCKQAIRLTTKLVPIINPDAIISIGDAMDFPSFSNFQSTERLCVVDAFQEIRPVWDELIDNLTEAAPEAVIVALAGNHERRLFKFMAENWQLFDTLQGVFAELMQSCGRVWWLGGAEQTSIGDLLVKHGRRCSINTARINLDKIGGGASVIQGHSHAPSIFIKKALMADSTYRVLYSAVAPGLQNIPPHYDDSAGETWLHGVAVAHIRAGKCTNMQNIIFAPTGSGGLECWYGGEYVEVTA